MPALLLAQTSTTSVLLGTVTDPTGAVVPGASVELTHIGTNRTFTTSTNASGNYVLPQVTSSIYRLSVSMQGFRTTTIGEIKVDVAKSYTFNVSLEVGAITQVVEIT
ncbi:MAG: carboxypeptidase-like regulatory domain-containing protein, partial [Candidatus Acidiferrales bacterium]